MVKFFQGILHPVARGGAITARQASVALSFSDRRGGAADERRSFRDRKSWAAFAAGLGIDRAVADPFKDRQRFSMQDVQAALDQVFRLS
jgi:hypothetical protein